MRRWRWGAARVREHEPSACDRLIAGELKQHRRARRSESRFRQVVLRAAELRELSGLCVRSVEDCQEAAAPRSIRTRPQVSIACGCGKRKLGQGIAQSEIAVVVAAEYGKLAYS